MFFSYIKALVSDVHHTWFLVFLSITFLFLHIIFVNKCVPVNGVPCQDLPCVMIFRAPIINTTETLLTCVLSPISTNRSSNFSHYWICNKVCADVELPCWKRHVQFHFAACSNFGLIRGSGVRSEIQKIQQGWLIEMFQHHLGIILTQLGWRCWIKYSQDGSENMGETWSSETSWRKKDFRWRKHH